MKHSFTQQEVDEFWSHVDKKDSTSCWNWKWYKMPFGHGLFTIRKKTYLCHRLSLIFTKRNFDYSLNVLHTCDNPSCVNPDHLYQGTQKDNVNDMFTRGRALVGNKCSWVKIKDEDIPTIFHMFHVEKLGQSTIARRFKVSQSQISRILSFLRRKHDMPTSGT